MHIGYAIIRRLNKHCVKSSQGYLHCILEGGNMGYLAKEP